jgi:dTMP kinase
MFIVFEGCDGVGKTTQSQLLCEKLKLLGYSTSLISFPNRTTYIGKLINSILSGTISNINIETLHLLFSANRWENIDYLRSRLNNNEIVIADRYSFSGIAYSLALRACEAEHTPVPDNTWFYKTEEGLPSADIIYFLNGVRHNRSSSREIYDDDTNFQQKVYEQYISLIENKNNNENWKLINVDDSIQKTHENILSFCVSKIKKC